LLGFLDPTLSHYQIPGGESKEGKYHYCNGSHLRYQVNES